MEYFRALEELNNSKGYDIALMTTFNFDINFFERSILRILENNDTKKINVFVDSSELVKTLNSVPNYHNSSLGKKYFLSPVEINGAFHPKLILLLGQSSAKLFIGSANLTMNGYCINNEAFNVIDYNVNSIENAGIINGAIRFFEKMQKYTEFVDEEIFDEVKRLVYYSNSINGEDCWFFDSIENDILSQLKPIVSDATEIRIAVPFYDNDLIALDKIHEYYPNAKIEVFLQHKKSCCPIDLLGEKKYINEVIAYKEFADRDTTSFYHGKVFEFRDKNNAYILYGSSNCTQAALTKSTLNGGNIECNLMEKGKSGDFDYYFDNFIFNNSEYLSCDLLEYNTVAPGNFHFKYGIMENDLILHVGYKVKKDIKVQIGESELEYIYENDLILHVPVDTAGKIGNIFDINIYIDGKTETIRCWYLNTFDIKLYRLNEKTSKVESFEYKPADETKYMQDRKALLYATSLCAEDLREEEELLTKIERVAEGSDIEETYEGEAIVAYEVPNLSDQEILRYKEWCAIRRIQQKYYAYSFFNRKRTSNKNTKKKVTSFDYDVPMKETAQRRAEPEEMKFGRFVKNRARGILNEEFVEKSNFDSYLFATSIFFEIFDKYTVLEKVDGMFSTDYLAKTKGELLLNIIKKYAAEEKKENGEFIIEQIMKVVLENRYGRESEDNIENIESINKNLITTLDQTFEIRENYSQYIETIITEVMQYAQVKIEAPFVTRYIESLFDYLPYSLLEELLKRTLSNDAKIDINEKSGEVIFSSNKIMIHREACLYALMEIGRYCKRYELGAKHITIKVLNASKRMSGIDNPITELWYKKDLFTDKIDQIIIRKDGKREIECIQKSVLFNKGTEDYLPEVKFENGDNVSHKKYGTGIIKEIANNKIIVEFAEGEKQIGIGQAPKFLTKL